MRYWCARKGTSVAYASRPKQESTHEVVVRLEARIERPAAVEQKRDLLNIKQLALLRIHGDSVGPGEIEELCVYGM
jgi:hypothetical protein